MGSIVELSATTLRGRRRATNQDRFALDVDLGVVILADGVAGRPHGRRAADVAVAGAHAHLAARLPDVASLDEARRAVLQAVIVANWAVRQIARCADGLRGMATTLLIGAFVGDRLVLGSVGDSRAYRLRAGFLKALTIDHRVGPEAAPGLDDEERALVRPFTNVLSRAIGYDDGVDPDLAEEVVDHDDLFVFCSNGVSDVMSPEEMVRVLRGSGVTEGPHALRDAALERGSDDEITVVIARPAR